MSGVETLKNVADILQFIDSISEIKDQPTKKWCHGLIFILSLLFCALFCVCFSTFFKLCMSNTINII